MVVRLPDQDPYWRESSALLCWFLHSIQVLSCDQASLLFVLSWQIHRIHRIDGSFRMIRAEVGTPGRIFALLGMGEEVRVQLLTAED